MKKMVKTQEVQTGHKERGQVAAVPPFSRAKIFFLVKSGSIKFLHENNMLDFSLFVEQDKVTKIR